MWKQEVLVDGVPLEIFISIVAERRDFLPENIEK
jgi:hypothetical protein